MKKILFILALALFIPSFSHAAMPDGCLSTYNFSPLNGLPCVDNHVECGVGDLFSYISGRPCSEVTQQSINTPQNTTADVAATATEVSSIDYVISVGGYDKTPLSLSKNGGNINFGIQVGKGKDRDLKVYITTPDGNRQQGLPSGNFIDYNKFSFATNNFTAKTPGTYTVRFEVPSYNIDESVQYQVVE